jgi:hypothetical protein
MLAMRTARAFSDPLK